MKDVLAHTESEQRDTSQHEKWRPARELPALLSRGATVVGSIWGRSTEEFAAAAESMRRALFDGC